MPTGVRMPVASMSVRALIGMVQAFDTPGNCKRLVHLGGQALDGDARPPLLFGLQVDDGLEHLGRRRIGRGRRRGRLCRRRRRLPGRS